jgi:hypothetical protein
MLGTVIHKVQEVIYSNALPHKADLIHHFSGLTEMELLSKVTEQLMQVGKIKHKQLLRSIDFVISLDEEVYPKLRSVTHNYLKSMSKNIDLQNEVQEAVHQYLRQLYTAYAIVITAYQNQSKLKLTPEKTNLLLGRFLNAAFIMAKWRYFDDQPAPLGMWKSVHKVIRVAEELAVMNSVFFLYEFQRKETSIAALLKRGFMLDTLQAGSYSQIQIELTDRILKTWSTNPLITNRIARQKEYQFFIHLSEDNRPQRIRGAKQHKDFRFWRTNDVLDLIESYLCAVDTRRPLDQFNIHTMASTEDIVSLFKKLRVDWCVKGYKRQRRVEDRSAKFSVLNVSHGIHDICQRVRALNHVGTKTSNNANYDQLSLLPTNESQHNYELNIIARENWVMLEESSSGFSVELGIELRSWVKAGTLIGYSTIDNANHIALAEIRAVRKKANGTCRIGLLKISPKAIVIDANKLQKSTSHYSISGHIADGGEENIAYSDSFSGLFIEGELQERSRLILPRCHYKRAARYRLKINDDYHLVLAGQVVSNHREWVCFELIV